MNLSDFAPVLYGLASAACFGVGDFSGGMATKRANVYSVLMGAHLVGALLLAVLALVFSEPFPSLPLIIWGGLGGIFGTIGILALYRALATGRMGVAAPVSAVISAALPVIFALFVETFPTPLQIAGFVLALIAVVLVSYSGDGQSGRGDLWLPMIAGIGFGLFFIVINQISQVTIFWPLFAGRITSLGIVFAYMTYTRQPKLPPSGSLLLVALAGILDASGNAFFALAGQVGRLDVASVVSSLYPAMTVLLAWLILKERITFPQTIGIGIALVALVLIAS